MSRRPSWSHSSKGLLLSALKTDSNDSNSLQPVWPVVERNRDTTTGILGVHGETPLTDAVFDTSLSNEVEIPENMEEVPGFSGVYIESLENGFWIQILKDGKLEKVPGSLSRFKPEFNTAWVAFVASNPGLWKTTFYKIVWKELKIFHSRHWISSQKQKAWFEETDLFSMKADTGRGIVQITDNDILALTWSNFNSIQSEDKGNIILRWKKSSFAKYEDWVFQMTRPKRGTIIPRTKRDTFKTHYKLGRLWATKSFDDHFVNLKKED